MTNSEFRLADAWIRVIEGGIPLNPEAKKILGILGSEVFLAEMSLQNRLELVMDKPPFTETYSPRDQDYKRIADLHRIILAFCGADQAHLWLNLVCQKMDTFRFGAFTPAFVAGSFFALLEFGVNLDQDSQGGYSEFQTTLLVKLFEVARKVRFFRGESILADRRFQSAFYSVIGKYVAPDFPDKVLKENRKKELANALKTLRECHFSSLELSGFSRILFTRVAHATLAQVDVVYCLLSLAEQLDPNLAIEFNGVKEEGDARQPTDQDEGLDLLKADGGDYPTSKA